MVDIGIIILLSVVLNSYIIYMTCVRVLFFSPNLRILLHSHLISIFNYPSIYIHMKFLCYCVYNPILAG